ncbi:unnamed protein product [Lathyrus oleraceus]
MATNIKILSFTFAILCIASAVASSSGEGNENEMFCGDFYGCSDDDVACCYHCATHGLHGKCYKNECCCDTTLPTC